LYRKDFCRDFDLPSLQHLQVKAGVKPVKKRPFDMPWRKRRVIIKDDGRAKNMATIAADALAAVTALHFDGSSDRVHESLPPSLRVSKNKIYGTDIGGSCTVNKKSAASSGHTQNPNIRGFEALT
jgi:hypothetical protein